MTAPPASSAPAKRNVWMLAAIVLGVLAILLAVAIVVLLLVGRRDDPAGGGGGDGAACSPGTQLTTDVFLSRDQLTQGLDGDVCFTVAELFLGGDDDGRVRVTAGDALLLEIPEGGYASLGQESAGSGERAVALAPPVLVEQGTTVTLDFGDCTCGGLSIRLRGGPVEALPTR